MFGANCSKQYGCQDPAEAFRHLYTRCSIKVSEQTYITSTCVPISDTILLKAGPSHQADHYMNINVHWSFAKVPLIEIKRGLSRGCWSVLLYSLINLWHVFTVNYNKPHSFPLGACECKYFNYSILIKTVQAVFDSMIHFNPVFNHWFFLSCCLAPSVCGRPREMIKNVFNKANMWQGTTIYVPYKL